MGKKKAPARLFVTREEAGTKDEYLGAREHTDEIEITPGETVTVYVYELKEVRKLVCTAELKPA